MNLLDILSSECVKVPLESTGKQAVIQELAQLLGKHIPSLDVRSVIDAVWAREQTRTTGIGQGLAIPHGKCDAWDRLLMAVGKPIPPIDFESIDRQPVQLVILLVSPPDRTSEHIQALARISRLMSNQDLRHRIYEAESAEAIYRVFEQHEASQAKA